MVFKIFDIGGSFLKMYSSNKGISCIPIPTTNTLSIDEIKEYIRSNVDESTEYIGLSSQMHGFVALSESKQITDFVTWKHSSSDCILYDSTFDDFSRTGLQKRADLPINNLFNILNSMKDKPRVVQFRNITEAILDVCNQKTHFTMACGSGFYDLKERSYITKYIDFFKKNLDIDLSFDSVANEVCISGYMNVKGRLVPVYTGIGDFQASVLGCNLLPRTLYVNMSTGSQIALIEQRPYFYQGLSCRPFFNNQYLKCYTHIPCGKFLIKIHDALSLRGIDFWKSMKTITHDTFFDSNEHILLEDKESMITNDVVMIFRGFIFQYINIIRSQGFEFDSIFLSGGIPKRLPIIKHIFEKEFGVFVNLHSDEDDSIRGVRCLLQTMKEKCD
jgi:hypothetical protein